MSTSNEQLIGVADANFRLLKADRRLARFVGDRLPFEGCSIIDLLPETSQHPLMLVARRVTREVVLATDGASSELLARGALVGDETWLLLLERGIRVEPYAPPPRRPFVGREAELAELERYLVEPGAGVLFVQGPLGIGKSALLAAFAARCEQLGCPYFSIDANAHPPSDDLIARVFTRGAVTTHPLERLVEATRALGPGRWVLLIDNFDAWQAVSDMVRSRPCAQLPPDCRIIVAARRMPDPRWWGATYRSPQTFPLGPLPQAEAEELASALGVPVAKTQEVARRAAGHPLSVVALASWMRTGLPLAHTVRSGELEQASASRWEILEAASIPARITEDVLATLLDNTEGAEALDLLTTLTLRDPSGIGLRMPLVLREAIKARLRERNPARLSELQRRLAMHLGTVLDSGTASHLVPIVDDFFDALDDRALIRRIAGSREDGLPSIRFAHEVDRSSLARAARDIGGERAAEAILRRIDRGFVATHVALGPSGIEGICQFATLTAASRAQLGDLREDGEIAASLELLRQRTVLEANEYVIACLAWVARDVWGGAWGSASQALFRPLFPHLVTAPRPAASIFVLPYANFPLKTRDLPGSDAPVTVGDHSLVYRDLRGMTVRGVLSAIVHADDERVPRMPSVARREVPISTETIREALMFVDQPERLVGGALLALRLVDDEAGPGASPSERAAALARVLRSMVGAVGSGGQRESRQREVLNAVFFEKSGKHEKIASELGMPYSTFRRQLARGIERVTEMVRLREQSARRAADEQH